MTPLPRPSLPVCLALLALAAAAVAWPLVSQAHAVAPSPITRGDLGYTLFAHWWAGQVWLGHEALGHTALVQWPRGQEVARQLWNLPVLFGTGWLHALLPPLLAYNVTVLALQALNAAAAAHLGRRVAGARGAWIAAATMLALPFAWHELFLGRLEQGFLAPTLCWLAAALDLRDGKPRAALRAGFWMAVVACCYWFYAPMAALGALPLLGRRLGSARTWRHLGVAAAVCAVGALPHLLYVAPLVASRPMQQSLSDAEMGIAEQLQHSWTPLSSGAAFDGVPWVAAALALAALATPAGRRFAGVAVVGLVFAAGPVLAVDGVPVRIAGWTLSLPHIALDALPGMTRFYWPYRWFSLIAVAAVAAAAVGARRLPPPMVAALVALVLVEGHLALPALSATPPPGAPHQLHAAHWEPAPGGWTAPVHVPPAFVEGLPGDRPVLQLPGPELGDTLVFYVPWLTRPVAGDSALPLHPSAKWLPDGHNGLYRAWSDPAPFQCPEQPADDARELAEVGFGWVLWHLPDPARFPRRHAAERQRAQCLDAALGPPDLREDRLLGWHIATLADSP